MRVGITTAADAYERFAPAFLACSLQPMSLPCIAIETTGERNAAAARNHAATADLMFVTSARSITHLWPHGGMPDTPVAAVGPATAAAVRNAGGHVLEVGDSGSHALTDILAQRIRGKSVAYPHAAGADPEVVRRLERAGAAVKAVTVYRSRPCPPPPDPVDAVVFASPSAVRGWLLARDLYGIRVAAIGPTTAAELERRGRPPDAVAPEPHLSSLAEALVERNPT